MERLTFEGCFCDIAMCQEVPCRYPDTGCTQRQVWERLREYEQTGLTPEEIRFFKSPGMTEICKWLCELKRICSGRMDHDTTIPPEDG